MYVFGQMSRTICLTPVTMSLDGVTCCRFLVNPVTGLTGGDTMVQVYHVQKVSIQDRLAIIQQTQMVCTTVTNLGVWGNNI